jgi:hypothetical protein
VKVRRLRAIAQLEALAAAAPAPSEADLGHALNAVTPAPHEDQDLYVHTEGELCRLILEYAPRLDDVIGVIAERMFWKHRHFDPRVPEVLGRRDMLLATRAMEVRGHPMHEAFQALKRPPGRFEALRALAAPRRWNRVRTLLAQLQVRRPEILAVLPPEAVAAWRRYYGVVRINPFVVAVVLALVLAVAGSAVQGAQNTARDVARYYPPAALKQQARGRAVLRCASNPDGALTGCQVIDEDPPGVGFGAAAARYVSEKRVARSYEGQDFSSGDRYEATLAFEPPDGVGGGGIRVTDVRSVLIMSGPDDAAGTADAGRLTGWRTVRGRVGLRCLRDSAGQLSDCIVISETPPGQGLGEYALMLAGDGKIEPLGPVRTIPMTNFVEFEASVSFERNADAQPLRIVPLRPVDRTGRPRFETVPLAQRPDGGSPARGELLHAPPGTQGAAPVLIAPPQPLPRGPILPAPVAKPLDNFDPSYHPSDTPHRLDR